jgi:hypothetical protein
MDDPVCSRYGSLVVLTFGNRSYYLGWHVALRLSSQIASQCAHMDLRPFESDDDPCRSTTKSTGLSDG